MTPALMTGAFVGFWTVAYACATKSRNAWLWFPGVGLLWASLFIAALTGRLLAWPA